MPKSVQHTLSFSDAQINVLKFCLGQGQKRIFDIKGDKTISTKDKNKAIMYDMELQNLYLKLRDVKV